MTAADIVAAAQADGVELRAGPDGLHLSGDRSAVARWAAAIRPVRDDILALLQPDPRIAELRRVLTDLLWDAPDEVEAEVARILADDAMAEALACYRRIRDEYRAAGQRHHHKET